MSRLLNPFLKNLSSLQTYSNKLTNKLLQSHITQIIVQITISQVNNTIYEFIQLKDFFTNYDEVTSRFRVMSTSKMA